MLCLRSLDSRVAVVVPRSSTRPEKYQTLKTSVGFSSLAEVGWGLVLAGQEVRG